MEEISVTPTSITDEILQMSQCEMAHLLRFAPAGHPYFDNRLPYYKIFQNRFQELGGMTVEISKRIGWE